MKQQLLLLLTASSLLLFSCQKETIAPDESIASSANSSRRNDENKLPFKGDYVTTAEFLAGPAVQRITGIGHATHMGESIFVANATVNFSTPPPFAIAGTAVFKAANGDEFYTQFRGTSTPTGNGTSRGDIFHTITGGTGRFEDATGNLIGVAFVNQANPTNTVTYDGSISY